MATAAENIQKLREMAGAPAPAAPAAVTPPAEVAPAAPPAVDPAPADAAAAPPAPSRWKRKLKVLDEERSVDLESMSDEEIDTVLGKGLAHDTLKTRYMSQRDEAREEKEAEAVRRQTLANDWWVKRLAKKGHRYNPETDEIEPLTKAPQTATPDPAVAANLEALKRQAIEEGTADAWVAFVEARTAAAGRQPTQQEIDTTVQKRIDERLAAVEQTRRAEEAHRQYEEDGARKIGEAFTARQADFDATGSKDSWEKLAKSTAMARYREVEASRKAGVSISHAQAHKYITDAIHETADLAKSHAQAARTATPPAARPKSPTVIPSGAGPPPAVTDPAKIDGSTPEGRQKRIEWMRANGAARAANGVHVGR